MSEGILLSKWGIRTIENGNTSLLSNSLVLSFLFSVINEKSKNEASEVVILFFLS